MPGSTERSGYVVLHRVPTPVPLCPLLMLGTQITAGIANCLCSNATKDCLVDVSDRLLPDTQPLQCVAEAPVYRSVSWVARAPHPTWLPFLRALNCSSARMTLIR